MNDHLMMPGPLPEHGVCASECAETFVGKPTGGMLLDYPTPVVSSWLYFIMSFSSSVHVCRYHPLFGGHGIVPFALIVIKVSIDRR